MATLRFLKAAWNDYVQLDGSQKKWVNQALHQLKIRGGEIGQRLSNTQGTKLHGCKKLKNRSLGLRIIFRENKSSEIEIIEIIVIGRREDSEVYRTAETRVNQLSEKLNDLASWLDQIKS